MIAGAVERAADRAGVSARRLDGVAEERDLGRLVAVPSMSVQVSCDVARDGVDHVDQSSLRWARRSPCRRCRRPSVCGAPPPPSMEKKSTPVNMLSSATTMKPPIPERDHAATARTAPHVVDVAAIACAPAHGNPPGRSLPAARLAGARPLAPAFEDDVSLPRAPARPPADAAELRSSAGQNRRRFLTDEQPVDLSNSVRASASVALASAVVISSMRTMRPDSLLEPCEPRIADHQLQQSTGRRDPAPIHLIRHLRIVQERLVEVEQAHAELREARAGVAGHGRDRGFRPAGLLEQRVDIQRVRRHLDRSVRARAATDPSADPRTARARCHPGHEGRGPR